PAGTVFFLVGVSGDGTCGLLAAHTNALHGLKDLALGLDRGRDDNFRLLKLAHVARANVPHAGRQRPDEILRTVVEFRRPEEDLFEGARHTNANACATRQVGVRRGHSPVESPAWRLLGARERAPDHHSVSPAGKRLADVTALAHAAIGDDGHVLACLFEVVIARRRAIYRRCDLWDAEA